MKVLVNALAHFLFSKACAVEAAEASSRSAERETPLSAFLFANFFFAPSSCKEKVANAFVYCYKLCAFGLLANKGLEGFFRNGLFPNKLLHASDEMLCVL